MMPVSRPVLVPAEVTVPAAMRVMAGPVLDSTVVVPVRAWPVRGSTVPVPRGTMRQLPGPEVMPDLDMTAGAVPGLSGR
jgi:hypothetical protein